MERASRDENPGGILGASTGARSCATARRASDAEFSLQLPIRPVRPYPATPSSAGSSTACSLPTLGLTTRT